MTCYAVIDTNVLVSALLSSHSNAATVRVVGKLPHESFIVTANEFLEILEQKSEK